MSHIIIKGKDQPTQDENITEKRTRHAQSNILPEIKGKRTTSIINTKNNSLHIIYRRIKKIELHHTWPKHDVA
jgi:hypothetical protein